MTSPASSASPDLADLRVLGAATTEVWAGASEAVSRGLVAWCGRILVDRPHAVRVARAACALVLAHYPTANARKWYIDQIIGAVDTWLAQPTREHQEAAMKLLDVTRAQHAWQNPEDPIHLWILEAVDHAGLAVWSQSDLSIYITPAPPKVCAARAVACVYHALLALGRSEADAAHALVAAVAAS